LIEGYSIKKEDVKSDIYKACTKFVKDFSLIPGEIFGVAWFEEQAFMGLRIFQVDPKNPTGKVIDMKVDTPVAEGDWNLN
jgi:hypothetical protein